MPDDNSTADAGDHAFDGDFVVFGTLEELEQARHERTNRMKFTQEEIDCLLDEGVITEEEAERWRS